MSHELDPKLGRWYRRIDDEQVFKVVGIDEDDGIVEIKTADGNVEELDSTEWIELDLEMAEPPEDYVEPDVEDDEDAEEEIEDLDKPKRGRVARSPKEGWDDDEEDDDWDEDDDGDDDYDSER
jgi:hypothetical protein